MSGEFNTKTTKTTKGVMDDATEALAHQFVDAAIQVHRALGPGLLEKHAWASSYTEGASRSRPRLPSQLNMKVTDSMRVFGRI